MVNLDTAHTLITATETLLGGGLGIAILRAFAKKYGNFEKWAVHVIELALSVGVGVLQYVQIFHAALPPEILGVSIPALLGYSVVLTKWSAGVKNFASNYQVVNTKASNTTSVTDTTNSGVVATEPATSGAEPTF